jgi:hypothetical protein
MPPELDRFIIRLLATLQLLASVFAFFTILFTLNYGEPYRNPAVLPLICLYSFFGVVSGVFLYLGSTKARFMALPWHLALIVVVFAHWFAGAQTPDTDHSGGSVLLSLTIIAASYLSVSALARARSADF